MLGRALAAALLLGLGLHSAAADPLEQCEDMLRYTGAPQHASEAANQRALCRKGYVLSYDAQHRVADWVVEVLTRDRLVKNVTRDSSKFIEDAELIDEERSELKDYRGSGYDRGHMAPAGDMVWDQEAMDQSFLLSNMAPQVGVGFNRGVWRELEEYVRDLVVGREPLVVTTGPAYVDAPVSIDDGVKKKKVAGDRSVTIPTHFYKILYDPSRRRAIAFLLPNAKTVDAKLSNYIVTIDEVERATGLDFLTALPSRDERRLEATRSLIWRAYEAST